MAKFRSISAVSFTFGNGISSGISTSRNSHKGAQPSDTLVIEKCYYDHSVRESKLSDHSAIISEFNFD